MKSTIDRLTPTEKEALARLYDMSEYAVLKKLLGLERHNIATKCLLAPNYEEVKFLHGQEYSLKQLHLLLQKNFRSRDDTEQKKQKS